MTPSEFVLARIAEDEAIARAAMREWHYDWKAQPYALVEDPPSEGVWAIPEGSDPDFNGLVAVQPGVSSECYSCEHSGLFRTHAEHIVRWSPARVLAECEAKRLIVERHSNGGHGDCSWCGGDTGGLYPCADLCDLVSVYADHPDYPMDRAASDIASR